MTGKLYAQLAWLAWTDARSERGSKRIDLIAVSNAFARESRRRGFHGATRAEAFR